MNRLLIPESVPKANAAVLEVMMLGGWWTLSELSARTGLSEATVSARIRDNRTKCGYPYTKRKRASTTNRVWEYQLTY